MNRIIIVQTAFLGDLILTTPLFRAIKKIHPDSYLTVVIRPEYRELMRAIPEIDELIFYDKRGRERGFSNFYKKIREIRLRLASLAVSPHRSARTALLLWQSHLPRRVGFAEAGLGFLYTDRVERDMSLHEVDRNLSLLSALGQDPGKFDRRPYLQVKEEWEKEASRLLPSPRGYIGIAPSSVWPTKRWIPSGFSRLIDQVSDRFGLSTVILGEPGAEFLAREITGQTKSEPINLVGKTPLGVLTAVVSKLKLLVSNDSGLVHVASARNIPAVVIFGPTSPKFGYGPLGPGSRTVELPLDCRPCHIHGPRECPQSHFKCMKEIAPEQVLEAVGLVLSSRE
jgi:heptosyltransferase-2